MTKYGMALVVMFSVFVQAEECEWLYFDHDMSQNVIYYTLKEGFKKDPKQFQIQGYWISGEWEYSFLNIQYKCTQAPKIKITKTEFYAIKHREISCKPDPDSPKGAFCFAPPEHNMHEGICTYGVLICPRPPVSHLLQDF